MSIKCYYCHITLYTDPTVSYRENLHVSACERCSMKPGPGSFNAAKEITPYLQALIADIKRLPAHHQAVLRKEIEVSMEYDNNVLFADYCLYIGGYSPGSDKKMGLVPYVSVLPVLSTSNAAKRGPVKVYVRTPNGQETRLLRSVLVPYHPAVEIADLNIQPAPANNDQPAPTNNDEDEDDSLKDFDERYDSPDETHTLKLAGGGSIKKRKIRLPRKPVKLTREN